MKSGQIDKHDAIIVLGGGRLNSGDLTELSKQRLDEGAKLYREGISNNIFALGGSYSTYSPNAIHFDKTGAELRRDYLLTLGVKPDDIILVPDGCDTLNEAFAIRTMSQQFVFKKLLLVTSDRHLKRALFTFKRILGSNFKIYGHGVPCGNLLNKREEAEYLTLVKSLLDPMPEEIPNPKSWEIWYQQHEDFYHHQRAIHEKYSIAVAETNQAYMGVSK